MKLSQFKFKLPEELIAQTPSEERDEARMMVLHKKTGEIEHKVFKDIIDYFDDGDLMLLNDTKVFPARLYGNKEKTNRLGQRPAQLTPADVAKKEICQREKSIKC